MDYHEKLKQSIADASSLQDMGCTNQVTDGSITSDLNKIKMAP